MTDTSSSAVGRAAIDAYLDSVEHALIAAHAPRSDRMQVLQDLESQIADMLAQQVSPLTEELVLAVIQKLEPPSHFARTYGNGKEPTPSASDRFTQLRHRMPHVSWSKVSAISCACIPAGPLLMFLAANSHSHGLFLFLTCIMLFGLVFTPIALWMASKELRASKEQEGRNLVLKSVIAYGVIAPTLVMAFAIAVTHGLVLVPFGIVSFVYLQYQLIRRVYRYMADAAPQPARAPNENGASSPAAATMSLS